MVAAVADTLRPFGIYSTTPGYPLPPEHSSVKRRPQDAITGRPRTCFRRSRFYRCHRSSDAAGVTRRSPVPDMPGRMVAATAVYFDVPVISRDRRIRAASLKTI
jgi:hypothetical protein